MLSWTTLRPSRRTVTAAFAAALSVGAAAIPALAQTPNLTTIRIASGLARAVYLTAPKGDYSRVFVLEQRGSAGVSNRGAIRVITMGANPTTTGAYTVLATPYLTIGPVTTGSEQGVLGLAFHPDFLNNGYFYVNYTASDGATIVARYRAQGDPRTSNVADPASFLQVLRVPQPFANHNGGWIDFGPDGQLYIALGDGGSANDPGNRSQNPNELLGKMLRIDVDGADNIPGNTDDVSTFTIPGGTQITANYSIPASNPFVTNPSFRPEIWATGLRNHWRNSFDRTTGALYIADVGQNAIEEISYQPPGVGGQNYGWRCYEGNNAFNTSGCQAASNYVFPIWEYSHVGGNCSITGGYVYRGCQIPALQGAYFFTDFCSSQIWTFNYAGSGVVQPANVINRTAQLAPGGGLSLNSMASFGEDAYGDLYITETSGEVYKIIPGAGTSIGTDCDTNGFADACQLAANEGLDCNRNGQLDSCDITSNPSLDCNTNGRIDSCELATNPALDCNRNGLIDSCESPAYCCWDYNNDNQLTPADIFAFLNGYFARQPRADTNFDGDFTPSDIFAFLNGYFARC
jgi:glucose/arabinose dehydrogenase